MFTKPTLQDAKRHMNVDGDLDDALIEAKITAAHELVTAYVDTAPAGAVHEATLRLIAHLYEAREGVAFDLTSIPAGVFEMIEPFRARAF